MSRSTDIRILGAALYFLPIQTRVPLKFGTETLTSVTCARVCVRVQNAQGQVAEGWGETPLSVQWVWPSPSSYELRHAALKDFTTRLVAAWSSFNESGHAFELGHDFQCDVLPQVWREFNRSASTEIGAMPWLAALVCCSAFDLALHDAFGNVHNQPVYELYGRDYFTRDLAAFLEPAADTRVSFADLYPADFLQHPVTTQLKAWHLVGGLDPIEAADLTVPPPDDGHPVLLRDWIRRDGLTCLKIKLRGNAAAWDYARLVKVGQVAIEENVDWLTTDFNCTVSEPGYVNAILDQLCHEHPRIYGMVLYVEQPFAYELEQQRLDVHSVSARKPLFLDESAHDWTQVRLGRELGWTGVALKTCKTQTGALLSACWAKAHGMTLMVQDLTNPMLAMMPHALLAAQVGTIMGVETNAPQFYPAASLPEAAVHPGLYQRRNGCVDFATLNGSGFGYRLKEISRSLPTPVVECGR